MKRCKYINEYQVAWLRNPLREGGLVYSNPTPEQLKALGYMPFQDTMKPGSRLGFALTPRYHMADGEVIRTWKYEMEGELP